jgi:hypothetical protein
MSDSISDPWNKEMPQAFRDALAKNDNDDAHCSISSSSSSGGDTNMSFKFSIPNHLPIRRLHNPHPPPDPLTYTQQIAEPKKSPIDH